MTAARQPPGVGCAKELLLNWMRTRPAGVYQSSIQATELERLIVLIDSHIAEAVAAERERCAAICRQVANDHYSAWAEVCETRIRSGREP